MAAQKYTADEKRIIRLLKKLPDETLLALAQTREQFENWQEHHIGWFLVSKCWKATRRGSDDPLFPLLATGEIDNDLYNSVWLTTDYHERLWELIQIGLPYIQPEIEWLKLGQLFTAFELFDLIVSEYANQGYSECLKPYHEESAGKCIQHCQLTSKAIQGELSAFEERHLDREIGKSNANVLLNIVLAACQPKATTRRRALKAKLEAFYAAVNHLNSHTASIARKSGSYAWKDGCMGRGHKDGTYKFS